MSLFGLMGDLDDDPFMGGHVRRMNSLMNTFFRDPFGDIFSGGHGRGGMLSIGGPAGLGGDLMPFTGGRTMQSPAAMMLSGGFPSLLEQMGNDHGGSHMSTMSTVMTMTQGPDGRPQVYQASQSVRQGPGGIRETKKTVADSRTGVKKMSIGRHVYDRGHVIEREQNIYSGDREENEEFINLDEEEADNFNKEWEAKARNAMHSRNAQPAIGYGGSSGSHRRRHHYGSSSHQQLALPSTGTNPPQPSQSVQEVVSSDTDEEEPPTKRKKGISVNDYGNVNINRAQQQQLLQNIVNLDDDDDEEDEDDAEDDEVEDEDDEDVEDLDAENTLVLSDTT